MFDQKKDRGFAKELPLLSKLLRNEVGSVADMSIIPEPAHPNC
jgi:hypothetical protein